MPFKWRLFKSNPPLIFLFIKLYLALKSKLHITIKSSCDVRKWDEWKSAHNATNLYALIVEQTQEVKWGKVNALFPVYNDFVAWRPVKEKHGLQSASFLQHTAIIIPYAADRSVMDSNMRFIQSLHLLIVHKTYPVTTS